MDKLAWVLLPLLPAAVWLGWCAWRGRLPPRAKLNAVFSLLLLLYLLATAGLGLYWVAWQHLPVFDWHYLSGYALLGLLAVHLAFNARALWHHLGAPGRRPGRAAAAAPARRPWLGALGLLGLAGSSGAAYWIGLRHGRTELRLSVAGDGDARGTGLALVEAFHEFSSHSRRGAFRRAASADWGPSAPPFKTIDPAERRVLPPAAKTAMPGALLTPAGLATLLWHTAGISAERGGLHLRTAPSSGALFASEFYLAVRAVPGLPVGLWHYQPRTHTLVRVQAGLPDALLLPADAPAALIATAVWRRSGHKYGDRCYRYVLADLGHALENARQAAAALGGGATLLPWFDEAALAQRLQVDEAEEGVLAQVLLHATPVRLIRPRQAPEPAALVAAPRAAAPGSAAPAGTVLGVTAAIHRGSSLRGAVGWSTVVDDAPTAALWPDVLRLIATRRSRRRFGRQPLPAVALQRLILAAAAAPGVLSDAVRVHVLTQAVQGHEPAAWHWQAETQRLVLAQAPEAGLRARARAAALDQDVVGDAAVVFVFGIERARFAVDPAGPARGYRHAFIEVGLAGERLYLQAQALGLAVCAVGAFHDDDAAALVAVDPAREWVLHLAAVGEPT